jgi:predicted DNA-binding protein
MGREVCMAEGREDNRVTARLPPAMARRLDDVRGGVSRADYMRRALDRQIREDMGESIGKGRRG